VPLKARVRGALLSADTREDPKGIRGMVRDSVFTRLRPSDAGHGPGAVNKWVQIGALFLLTAFVWGCAAVEEKPERTAEESYLMGMEKFEKEDYRDAVPFFQQILENYPFSIHAIPAELKIAECYFLDEKYLEALVHLQGFQELHPTNESVPYVIWMKVVSYFEQFSTIDRDIASLQNAKRELIDLTNRFAETTYAQEAGGMLAKVDAKLAEHDFYVAHFYYRSADYSAALSRFQRIMEIYPEEGVADRALYYIGKCYYFLREEDASERSFRLLTERYPESPYSPKAEEFLKDIEQGRFTLVSRYFRLKERILYWMGYE
jgi:outer membrane protein assembly factor BamD